MSSASRTIVVRADGSAPSAKAVAFAVRRRSSDGTLVLACAHPYGELHCDAYDFGTPASETGPGFYVDHETRDRRARERLDTAVAAAETA